MISAAAAEPCATMMIETGGRSAPAPVVERDGEILVVLGDGLKSALGAGGTIGDGKMAGDGKVNSGGVTVECRLPFVTISRNGRALNLSAGLSHASGPGRATVWMPEPLRLVRGFPCLSPSSLVCALASLGYRCAWIESGCRIRVIEEEQGPGRSGANAPVQAQSTITHGRLDHIVVDAGHGGGDCGARGASGICEKVLTLDVAMRVAKLARAQGIRVTLTRETDEFVSLQRRAEIAHAAKPDLFVSVHVNSARSRAARGVETYVYGEHVSSSEHADVVSRENGDSNYVDIWLSDLAQQKNHDASVSFAGSIEDQLVQRLKTTGRAHKRVFEAPFYVLAKADCPAVLIEVGFISNREEERKLRLSEYRQKLAETIAGGLFGCARASARVSPGRRA